MQGGKVIQDRYELKELIGRGGMAEVWLAHDSRLDRPVAIKFLNRGFGDDPEHLVRFFAEAQSVARIQHANVATVLDFGEMDGYPFLVMYYLTGGSLADLIGEPMPPRRALELAGDIAAAAGAAHALGIVHRDIKPDNVLLDESGNPRLADFGIASMSAGERLTATGTAIGSPHYISPEQALSAGSSPASDVYAIGIVLFEMLTGRRLFEGDSIPAVVFAHVEQTPSPPSTHAPGLDPGIDDLVLRCLAKDPEERFGNGTELSEAIGALLGSLPQSEPGVVAPAVSTAELESVPEIPRRRRHRAAVIALPVVVILAAAGFILLSGSSDPTTPKARAKVEASPTRAKKDKTPEPDESSDADAPSTSPSPGEPNDQDQGSTGGTGNDGGGDDGDDGGTIDPEPSPEPSPTPTAEASPIETPSP